MITLLEWTEARVCNCRPRCTGPLLILTAKDIHGNDVHVVSHPVRWASEPICLCPLVVVPSTTDGC